MDSCYIWESQHKNLAQGGNHRVGRLYIYVGIVQMRNIC